jgi:hypothetical protein
MLKSDAELIVRRALEDHEAKFTEEQIKALAQMILKVSGRLTEEAMASIGSKGTGKFFAD